MSRSAADSIPWCFREALLPAPEADARVLYVNAQASTGLGDFVRQGQWTMLQPFKPWADRLGTAVATEWPSDPVDYALVLCGKQKEDARGALAQAAIVLKAGGWLVCAAAADAGGRRLVEDCAALGFAGESLSKYHARILIAQKTVSFNAGIAASWTEDVAMKPCAATGFVSCPGLFSWDRVDAGSALLASQLPDDLKGKGADFGCGWGYLSRHVLRYNPGVKALYVLDADARALDACRVNLAGAEANIEYVWADLNHTPPLKNLDFVVMNPPFHEGHARNDEIGPAFIRAAAGVLRRGGMLHMVANARRPYEAVMSQCFSQVEKRAETKDFKIFCARV